MIYAKTHTDEAMRKGAVEDDPQHVDSEHPRGHNSLTGQLGHRDQDDMLKDNDTDFPEPDAHKENIGG